MQPAVPAAEEGEREGAVGGDETDQRAPLVGERERETERVGWASRPRRRGIRFLLLFLKKIFSNSFSN